MEFFEALKSVVKVKNVKSDNLVFLLHYKMTCPIFTLCFVAMAATQLFGVPIKCTGSSGDIEFATQYCWAGYLHIIVNPHFLDAGAAHAQPQTIVTTSKSHTVRWLSAYRWLPILLGLHAISFYLTRYMWKLKEGGLIEHLTCQDMKSNTQTEWNERRGAIVRLVSGRFGTHKGYGTVFCCMELTNLLINVLNILAIDYYLGTKHYGLYQVGILEVDSVLDFNTIIWPNTAKCVMPISGPSGTVVNWDYYCVLGHSAVYGPMYGFLWWWLLILIGINELNIIKRFVSFVWPAYRMSKIYDCAPTCDREVIREIIKRGNFGDYLVLSMVGQSMSSVEFQEILTGINQRIPILYDLEA